MKLIQKIWHHPLIEPLRAAGREHVDRALNFARSYWKTLSGEYKHARDKKKKFHYGAALCQIADRYDGHEGTVIAGCILFGIVGAIAGGFWGWAAGGTIAAAAAGVAGVGVAGAFAGPFLLVGCIAAVAAVTYAPFMAAVKLVSGYKNLIKKGYDAHQEYKRIEDLKARQISEETDGAMKTTLEVIEKLPATERVRVLEELEKKFKDEFAAIGEKKIEKMSKYGISVESAHKKRTSQIKTTRRRRF